MASKYVVKKGQQRQYRFTLTATNGRVTAPSRGHETRRALADIKSVTKSAPDSAFEDKTGRQTDIRMRGCPSPSQRLLRAARPAGRRLPAFMPLACGHAELRHPHAARGDPNLPRTATAGSRRGGDPPRGRVRDLVESDRLVAGGHAGEGRQRRPRCVPYSLMAPTVSGSVSDGHTGNCVSSGPRCTNCRSPR